MKAYKYRHLLWYLIGALDTGKYDNLTIDEVRRHVEAGTVSSFLVDRFGKDLDLSIFDPADWIMLSDTWYSIKNAIDARRKFGVENRGICLLMAYTLESMQQSEREEKEAA